MFKEIFELGFVTVPILLLILAIESVCFIERSQRYGKFFRGAYLTPILGFFVCGASLNPWSDNFAIFSLVINLISAIAYMAIRLYRMAPKKP